VLVNGQAAPGAGGAPIDVVCSRGAFVATHAANTSPRPLRTRRLTVRFEPTAGRCAAHTAEIDPVLERTLEPGQDQELRVFDAAGSLCQPPHGTPFCDWRVTATVATDVGDAAGTLDFRTRELPSPTDEAGCTRTPNILTPRDGDVVSGVVAVTANVVESSRCVITARTIVHVYTDSGDLVATSTPLDFGDTFRWDTRRFGNGRYRLRGAQSCCQIDGEAVRVTVRN
jgi:hypothetical protein